MFQASSFIFIGSSSLSIAAVVAVAVIIKYIFIDRRTKFIIDDKVAKLLILLLTIGISIPLCSLIWGRKTFETRFDYWSNSVLSSTAAIDGKNVINYIIVVIFAFAAICIYQGVNLSKEELYRAMDILLYIFVFSALIQYGYQFGVIPEIVVKILYSNDNSSMAFLYGRDLRLYGSFLEPSYCGGFLTCMLCVFIHRKPINKWKLILIIACVILNRSSTVILGSIISIAILILFDKNKTKTLIYFILGILAMLLLYDFGIIDRLVGMVNIKLSSLSGIQRTKLDLLNIRIIKDTMGIGIGYGNTRANNFIISFAAQCGLIGILTYCIFVYSLLKSLSKHQELAKNVNSIYFMIACLVTQIISCPDITYNILWLAILICLGVISIYEQEDSRDSDFKLPELGSDIKMYR